MLLAIAMHAGQEGYCELPMDTLRQRCALTSVRGARKVIRSLESKGFVSTEQRSGKASRYRVTLISKANSEEEKGSPAGNQTPTYQEYTFPGRSGGNTGSGATESKGRNTGSGRNGAAEKGGNDDSWVDTAIGTKGRNASTGAVDNFTWVRTLSSGAVDNFSWVRTSSSGVKVQMCSGQNLSSGARGNGSSRGRPAGTGRGEPAFRPPRNAASGARPQGLAKSYNYLTKKNKNNNNKLLATTSQTEKALIGRGVHPAVAHRLVRRYGEEAIHRQVEHYDRLLGSPGGPRGPGWLIAAIRRGFVPARGSPGLLGYDEMIRYCESRGDLGLTKRFEAIQKDGKTYFKLRAS